MRRDTHTLATSGLAMDHVSEAFCTEEAAGFPDNFTSSKDFLAKGGFAALDAAFETGMVLTMALCRTRLAPSRPRPARHRALPPPPS